MPSTFRILNPCQERLALMPGDDERSWCSKCSRHVHRLEGMSLERYAALKASEGGRLCGFISAAKPEQRPRREILFGAMLTLASPLFAQAGRLLIRVRDPKGKLFLGASIEALGPTFTTDEEGEHLLAELPLGPLTLTVRASALTQTTRVVMISGTELQTLEVVFDELLHGEVGALPPARKRKWYRLWLR